MTEQLNGTALPLRVKLPSRRPGMVSKFEWQNHKFFVCCGFDYAGRVKEIFLDQDQGRSGSNIESLLDDFAVSASLNLQFGLSLAQLFDKLSRQSGDTLASNGEPLSLFGALIQHAGVIENEYGANMVAAFKVAGRSQPKQGG